MTAVKWSDAKLLALRMPPNCQRKAKLIIEKRCQKSQGSDGLVLRGGTPDRHNQRRTSHQRRASRHAAIIY